MFARLRITDGDPVRVDDGVQHFRDVVVPTYKSVAGFKGAYLLVNRKRGRLMGITLWDTEANLRATAAASEQLRAEGAQSVSGNTHSVEVYEVVVQP